MGGKNNFRKARNIYKETHEESQPGKTGLNNQVREARYFVGLSPRGDLFKESVIKYFGEEYANKHMQKSLRGDYFKWGTNDPDAGRMVSQEEIENYRGRLQALAHRLIEIPSPNALVLGAQLYELLGKGKKAVPKILKFAPIVNKKYSRPIDPPEIEFLEEFIEKHTGTRPKNLETYLNENESPSSHLGIFILSTISGIALAVSSANSNLTGHVVSGVLSNSEGLFGALLFVFGLVGLFFNYFRNNSPITQLKS